MWKNLALASLSGILLCLAWPPLPLGFLLFLAWTPLLFVYHQSKDFKSFLLPLLVTLLLWNIGTTWWIGNAHWIGAVSATLVNTLLMASVFIIHFFAHKKLPSRWSWILFIALWISMEFIMHRWDLLWPWLSLGNGFANLPSMIQWYEYTGIFGGTLWVWACNIIILLAIINDKKSIRKWVLPGSILLLPIAFSWFLDQQDIPYQEQIKTGIIQPNFDPYTEKFELNPQVQLQRFFKLARQEEADLIVGPETVYPSYLWQEEIEPHKIPGLSEHLNSFPNQSVLLGSTVFKTFKEIPETTYNLRKLGSNVYYKAYNSALFFNFPNQTQISHKGKLVPGAEAVPFARHLGFLKNLSLDLGGTSGGLGLPDSLSIFKGPHQERIASGICYESVCGNFMADKVALGANLIAVITNDAWWGNTAGHKQHLAYARLRAIENRREIVRSANTGISAHIDARGQILESIPYGETGAIFVEAKLHTNKTFYTKHGDIIGRLALFLAVVFLLYALAKPRP